MPGFAAELRVALSGRANWLVERGLAAPAGANQVAPEPQMLLTLRQHEIAHVAETLARQMKATYLPHEPGSRVSGIYERHVVTPTGKIAVIRREDTFTLAPWRPALEPLRGRAVTGLMGPKHVTWTLDRGRGLPGRT
jgi:hypothetical protein